MFDGECFTDLKWNFGGIWRPNQWHKSLNNSKEYCKTRCSSAGFKYYGLKGKGVYFKK